MNMNQKGFTSTILVLLILGIVIAGAIGYFVLTKKPVQTSVTTETSAWKTYRNNNYGFEMKYPPKFGQVFFTEYPASESTESCRAQGFVALGGFSSSSRIEFGGASSDYTICFDRGISMFEFGDFLLTDHESKIILGRFEPFSVTTKINTASGESAYLFETESFGLFAALRLHSPRLKILLFNTSPELASVLSQILSTFKFTN